MSVSPAPAKRPGFEDLERRRRAVDSALGSLRIENMELERDEQEVFERLARGEISLDEMDLLVEQMTATIH